MAGLTSAGRRHVAQAILGQPSAPAPLRRAGSATIYASLRAIVVAETPCYDFVVLAVSGIDGLSQSELTGRTMDDLETEVVRLKAALMHARADLLRHERGASQGVGTSPVSEQFLAELRAGDEARLEASRQQDLLNQELSHRLKNTLAMVQAIASQTLKHVTERHAVDAFRQRLAALGLAHDILLQQSWAAAPIGTVVEKVLAFDAAAFRVKVQGPDVQLGSKAVLQLSLVLHELTTNAVKYGSLSVETGEVALEWQLDGPDEAKDILLTWTETGGPPASTPTRTGFGSRLIRTGLGGTGGVEMRYPAEGFFAEFRTPLGLLIRE